MVKPGSNRSRDVGKGIASAKSAHAAGNTLALRHLAIDTYGEAVVYMRADCAVCRSVGLTAQSRVRVTLRDRSLVATLNTISGAILRDGEAGLSEVAWRALDANEGETVTISHPPLVASLSHVRSKAFGKSLDDAAMRAIVADVVGRQYSDIQIASFLTACAGDRMSLAEVASLARAMIDAGQRIRWESAPIVDKHCVGGLPGNRTTLIVVPIVAAAGLCIPKTSSRAITSPAGTADTMEVLAPVDLDIASMRRVVEREGGCIVWGGAAALSPADDILIRVERPLELDSEGQLVASVLSKKAAAGATHVVIDVPTGPTAKVRSDAAADRLRLLFERVAEATGLSVRVLVTDGSEPVGRGIGPALEARDALAVLQGAADAPRNLRERALALASAVIEIGRGCGRREATALAETILSDGRAARKFEAICEAQGGRRIPPIAPYTRAITALRDGVVRDIDNRRLARVAKLAGAPRAPAAGVEFRAPLGKRVALGEPLFVVHAQAHGELAYALEYLHGQPDIVALGDPP